MDSGVLALLTAIVTGVLGYLALRQKADSDRVERIDQVARERQERADLAQKQAMELVAERSRAEIARLEAIISRHEDAIRRCEDSRNRLLERVTMLEQQNTRPDEG